jgi:hypothetical protein
MKYETRKEVHRENDEESLHPLGTSRLKSSTCYTSLEELIFSDVGGDVP